MWGKDKVEGTFKLMKPVTIIVAAYHQTRLSVQLTIECLTNITKYTDSDKYNLIVIEDTPMFPLRDDFSIFKIDQHIILDEYTNYSTKMNLAAAQADTPYLCFIQNDCFVWEGWLDTLLYYFDNKKTQAMVPYQFGMSREQMKKGYAMSLDEGFDMGAADACMIMVTKEAFDKAGGFNDNLQAFVERDFYHRLNAAGVEVNHTNKVHVTHVKLGTHYQDLKALDRKTHHDSQIENHGLPVDKLDRRRQPIIEKRILITGGSGSLGKAILERLPNHKIRVLSRSETNQLPLVDKFPNAEFILGDVRDKFALKQALKDVDIVIHAAAFKFLNLAEVQVRETIQTNVIGTMNLIEAIEDNGNIEQCVGISTDKVVYARNVYGCTKHIMEKLFKEADRNSNTVYSCVRYGNVLGTTGSVHTIWDKQLAEGKPLTVTDENMRRFFFSVDEAVDLIFYALDNMVGGEVFTVKMPSYSIHEMAKELSENIEVTGLRPGEKINETLIGDYEGEEFTSEQSGDNEVVVIK